MCLKLCELEIKIKLNSISINKGEQTYMYVWLKSTYKTATEFSFLVFPLTYIYAGVVDLKINVQNPFKQRTSVVR